MCRTPRLILFAAAIVAASCSVEVGAPGADSGTDLPDAAPVAADVGTAPDQDAASVAGDIGSASPTDAAAVPGADAAALPGEDAAGQTPPDAGQPGPDAAALPGPDAAALPGPDASSPGPDAGPLLLGTSHPGWKKKNCYTSGCHTEAGLTRPTHVTGTRFPTCSNCHGGNGSCDPNGGPFTGHTAGVNCQTSGCHSTRHGYSVAADCAACHMPALGGVSDCTP